VRKVVAGARHTCALMENGALRCWGNANYGQLGYGDASERTTPPAAGVDLGGVSAYQLTAGENHTCALRANGTARCWGHGGSGRLGDGMTVNIHTPAAVGDIAILEANPSGSTYATSCRDQLSKDPAATDGVYVIDPDGPSGLAPFNAYCDMTTSGGGWTRVTYWNAEEEGHGQAELTGALIQEFNNMGRFTFANASFLEWADYDWGFDALALRADVKVPNSGEVRLATHFYGYSMEQSAVWFFVQDQNGSDHNLLCRADLAAEYTATELSYAPGYSCADSAATSWTWNTEVSRATGAPLTSFHLHSLMGDADFGDYARLYRLAVWVR
jgi:hypothetical protein